MIGGGDPPWAGQWIFLWGGRQMEEGGLTLLQQMEREVLAEGREWMRQRLKEKLEGLAAAEGEVSPPQRGAADSPSAKRCGAGKRSGKG